MVQLPDPAATVEQLFVCEKSAELVPVIDTALIVSVAVPGFVTVMDSAELVVFRTWLPKLHDDGEKLIWGAVPVPVNATVCGEPEAVSVTEIDALRLPVAEGVNVT